MGHRRTNWEGKYINVDVQTTNGNLGLLHLNMYSLMFERQHHCERQPSVDVTIVARQEVQGDGSTMMKPSVLWFVTPKSVGAVKILYYEYRDRLTVTETTVWRYYTRTYHIICCVPALLSTGETFTLFLLIFKSIPTASGISERLKRLNQTIAPCMYR